MRTITGNLFIELYPEDGRVLQYEDVITDYVCMPLNSTNNWVEIDKPIEEEAAEQENFVF